MRNFALAMMVILIITSCDNQKQQRTLPVLGRTEISEGDTIYHHVADFQFVNQDSTLVSEETFKDKVYVADFFFTSCPTICPVMKTQMLRVYEAIQGKPDVMILSHTIDPKHDSVAVLKEFADKLGVSAEKWHFVTGKKEEIYKIGQSSYMVSASEDPTEPGGYIHSGAFILVDKERRVRGLYDGTRPDQVDKLITDIDLLLKEYK